MVTNGQFSAESNLPVAPILTPVYAGFWIRGIASLIDDVIVFAGSTALSYAALYFIYLISGSGKSFGDSFTGGFIQTVNLAAMTFFSLPYFIGFHWKFGCTPGKKIFGIVVVRESNGGSLSFGRSCGRYFAQALSALPFGAGFLIAAFDERKRALHDRIAGTVSIVI
ncbi:MAG: RDD family protein [Cryobacterium sp.]|nr:RDD family protein [Oligoflexia bacterium]